MFSYFDSSALVRLYHDEPGTDFLDRLLESQGGVVIASRLTLVEVESAVAIKLRTGSLDHTGAEIVRRRLRSDVANGRVRVVTQIEAEDYTTAQNLV
ncbi:MAG: type II toxin-antitoxin system VapC family toxin, partial [Acidobacteria bacterium]|nr:type II toxin-antitoxin system VapC family toxin [Acidobacteriota bacterium]